VPGPRDLWLSLRYPPRHQGGADEGAWRLAPPPAPAPQGADAASIAPVVAQDAPLAPPAAASPASRASPHPPSPAEPPALVCEADGAAAQLAHAPRTSKNGNGAAWSQMKWGSSASASAGGLHLVSGSGQRVAASLTFRNTGASAMRQAGRLRVLART
jgi:hypothetical protein